MNFRPQLRSKRVRTWHNGAWAHTLHSAQATGPFSMRTIAHGIIDIYVPIYLCYLLTLSLEALHV